MQKVAKMIDKSHWWSVSTSMVGNVMVDNSRENVKNKDKDGVVEILEHEDINQDNLKAKIKLEVTAIEYFRRKLK